MAPHLMTCRLLLDAGTDIDASELARLTRRLRDEISKTPVEAVSLVDGAVPASEGRVRSKAMDATQWGALLVTMAPLLPVFSSLVDVLKSWALRRAGCRVSLEINGQKIDAAGLSAAQQARLIEEFLSSTQRVVVARE